MVTASKEEIINSSEMSKEDIELLICELVRHKPKKVVEIGMSAGGTTCIILDNITKDATLYSVDINRKYYRDETKKAGYIAENVYDETRHASWERFLGVDICDCVEQIGHDIDFVILDTVHALPGEFLSFMSILPYMSDQCVLILHDLSMHVGYKVANKVNSSYEEESFCTSLLFNAIISYDKILANAEMPNCGAIIINKQLVMKNMFMIINMLFVKWNYMPPANIILDTFKIVKKFYSISDADFFEKAIQYNLKKRGMRLTCV